MLNGLSFATIPTNAPVSLTPYMPLFLLPLVGLGKLFSIDTLRETLVFSRIFQTGLLFFLFFILNRMRKTFFDSSSSLIDFVLAATIVFSFSPIMVTALRPDTLSFLFEITAVFSFLFWLKNKNNRTLIGVSFLFSLALLTKLNTLGGVVGILLFLFFSKNWRAFFLLGLSTAFFSFLGFGILWIILGKVFSQNIFLSIQSRPWTFFESIEVYKKVFDLFLIPLGFYFFLIIWGLRLLNWKEASRAMAWVLSLSFLLAFLGQMKWGAFHNYFLGVLYLGAIPASCAIHQLKNQAPRTTLFFILAYLFLFSIRGLSIPHKIYQESRFFSEFNRLHELVNAHVPEGFLYTPDERLHLGFYNKTALGVLTEELFWTTPKLKPYWQPLLADLESQGGHRAFIIPCSSPPPEGWGYHPRKFPHRIQTGWYCLYY